MGKKKEGKGEERKKEERKNNELDLLFMNKTSDKYVYLWTYKECFESLRVLIRNQMEH